MIGGNQEEDCTAENVLTQWF